MSPFRSQNAVLDGTCWLLLDGHTVSSINMKHVEDLFIYRRAWDAAVQSTHPIRES